MLTYQLGSFSFHGMWGTPGFAEAAIGMEVRPGVNGTTLTNLGEWGKPFEIETVVGCATYAHAIALCDLYKPATTFNPQTLIIGSVEVSGSKYAVLSVDAKAKRVINFKVAGDATVYQAEVRARWTLLPLANID